MSEFPVNTWWAAALSDELGEALLARRLLGKPVLLYRTQAGDPVAMLDACPHRFASLSKGRRLGDQVECIYHGLRFDPTGACTRSPYHETRPTGIAVETFPIVDRYGIAWIWMGAREAADPATIPDHSMVMIDGYRWIAGHETYRGDWQLCVDNLMDLTHLFWLHTSTIGGYKEEAGPLPGEEYIVRQDGNRVIGRNLIPNIDKPSATGNGIPPGVTYDQWNDIVWTCPGSLTFAIQAAPAGVRKADKPYMAQTHLMTPAGEGEAHYFWAVSRSFDNEEHHDAKWQHFFGNIFRTEDAPMMEDIERNMGGRELMDLRPVILPRDRGAVMARRTIARAIAAEKEAPAIAAE